MLLRDLLYNVDVVKSDISLDTEITNLTFDSRQASVGSCFVATRGVSVDSHKFIPQVLAAGTVAVVGEETPATIIVRESREALGRMAGNWYGRPSERLKLVGVTGTNGKTSIATLLWQLFRKLGYKVGLLSTVVNYIDDQAIESTHTTPDPVELNSLLRDMADAGCDYVFMEVSSHSVDQRRIAGLRFVGGIFTNLTRDHLDYHKTVENYLKAKKRFFDDLPRDAFALTNLDDRNGNIMLQNCNARRRGYSVRTGADYKGVVIEESFEGMQMKINGLEAFVPFVGRFNASNVMAVFGAACELGVAADEALRIITSLKAVAGRFETLRLKSGVIAIIDYAHTPDALENVIKTINEIKKGRLITVCGCGGNRDKGKRPMMALAAARGSELVVLTSDNPRDEDPEAILDDMMTGLENQDLTRISRIADRREAIKMACTMIARPNDVVLIAGKGHEDYQIIKGVKHHFSDRETVLALNM